MKRSINKRSTLLLAPCFFLFFAVWNVPKSDETSVHNITVSANVNWMDTGLDVSEGQEIYFKASGEISLQKGNPMAHCGPDGYDLKSVQQPLLDRNIGALIGKVSELISVTVDKETGEEIRNEIFKYFFVGSESKVSMPMSGRLLLGINENVVGDNDGEYSVMVSIEGNQKPIVRARL